MRHKSKGADANSQPTLTDLSINDLATGCAIKPGVFVAVENPYMRPAIEPKMDDIASVFPAILNSSSFFMCSKNFNSAPEVFILKVHECPSLSC